MKILFTKANLEGWALVAEIGGAIAVIMSVIYLGKQINDNTKLLRSQAHYNALSLAQRPLEMMVENESLAGAVTQCDANPNGVAATTWERCARPCGPSRRRSRSRATSTSPTSAWRSARSATSTMPSALGSARR